MKSNIKKSLLFAFTVAVLTVLTVFSVSARTVTKNKLVYEINKKTAVLIECKSNAKKIKVPSKVGKYKVTAIGAGAFSDRDRLQSVEIPKTVTKFGKNIFVGCGKLTAYVVKGSKAEKYIKKQKNVALAYRYMTSLSLDAESLILSEGESYRLDVTVKPKKLYNSKVAFTSDNAEVASVNGKGLLTAKAPGTAVITCKAKDGSGKKAVCTVRVNAKKAAKAVSVAPVAPAAVTGLKVTAASDSTLSLSWNAVKNASGYKVYLADGNGGYTYKWATSSAKAEIKGLEAGREYTFAVKAYSRSYYSSTDSISYSAPVTAKTLPGKVSEIRAEDELIYPDRMTLSWDAVDGAEGYNLYIYDKVERDYVLYESTDALACEVTGLSTDTEYRFRMKTFSGENKAEGSFSETFSFTTDYLPSDKYQAAEDFIKALAETGGSDGSFDLYTRYDASDFEGVIDEISSIEDALYIKERGSFTFERGQAERDGEKITVSDVIYPCSAKSGLVRGDIISDSISYAENGSGYTVSFDVSSDEAESIIELTDIDSFRKSIPGFVLHSYETENVSVSAKITEGIFEYLQVSVPVKLSFFLGGEKHEIAYTVSQSYYLFG